MMKITLLAATLALAATTARADIAVMDNKKKLNVDCAKDKVVTVLGNKADITLNGVCDRVSITGNNATVRGSVAIVQIAGNENTLLLDAVDELLVTGNKNTITYKKGVKEKTPKVSVPGNDNKINQTK